MHLPHGETELAWRGLSIAGNPFGERTLLRFQLGARGPVDLEIYDVGGRRVRTLLAGVAMDSGVHEVVWDVRNEDGHHVASGIYFVSLHAGKQTFSRTVAVAR